MQAIILVVTITALAAASFTDIKKREVPDWLNYGLVVFGLGTNLLLSVAFWTWTYIAYSVFGMLALFAIAYFMFYAGQWGGGDSKMLIGLGSVFGLAALSYHFGSTFSLREQFTHFCGAHSLLLKTGKGLLKS